MPGRRGAHYILAKGGGAAKKEKELGDFPVFALDIDMPPDIFL